MKEDFVGGVLRFVEVKLVKFEEGKIGLRLFGGGNVRRDGMRSGEVERGDLGRRKVDVMRRGEVGGVWGREERKWMVEYVE